MKKVEKTEPKKALEQAFALWKNFDKNGKEYYTGNDLNDHKLIAFNNIKKKNENEPDIRVYELNKENEIGDNVASLWSNTSKDGKTNFMSGVTSDDEKLVAFYNSDTSNNKPYLRCYFKDEN